ncbi:hypothetical protein AB205_0045550 [Aquarana catesbeiana]|uniref:Uncharacterized protein n=1 Tax=Aquarana catesbeiana TaxID=8400 RepID=A0A2G9QB80_AQUCT|nr:hypothetical protein AB205_0045550 [Aquarana catesbeiana]
MFPISRVLPSNICVLSIPFLFYIGEKRLRHPSSQETRAPPPLEEGEIPQTQEEEQEEEEDVVEIGTTTGDRDPERFTSESAQILIGEIMGCNLQLQNIQQQITDVIKKNNNIIDVLGRI